MVNVELMANAANAAKARRFQAKAAWVGILATQGSSSCCLVAARPLCCLPARALHDLRSFDHHSRG